MIVTIDSTGWIQDKKNMTKAMCSKLLYADGITHEGIVVSLPNIEVINNSADISSVLTTTTISDAYEAWKIINDAALAAVQAEAALQKAEVLNSKFRNIKLAQINAAIDDISNYAELKEFLRKFTKYVVSKGV